MTTLLVIFLAAYISLMFYKEDFAYYDNVVLTNFSLIGQPYWMPIWRDQGRFWPLGFQEYNFLALLGKNGLVYRSFSIFQLLTVLFCANKILFKLPTWYRFLTMIFVTTIPSFVISFFGFIYPERNVVFWLAILVACAQYLHRSEPDYPRLGLYGMLISAQFCLYYKEPVFILIGAFAGSRIILNGLLVGRDRLHRGKCFDLIKATYGDLGLIVLSAIFFILYQVEVARYVVSRYHWYAGESSFDTFLNYLSNNFLLSTFLVTFIARVGYLLFNKKYPDQLWDPLALGAALYFLAFVRLNMYQNYYMAPVDLIAALYVSYFIFQAFSKPVRQQFRIRRYALVATAVAIGTLIVNQNIQQSSFAILFRKTLIHGNVQLAQALSQYAKSSQNERTTLFFPDPIEPTSIANFAAYLQYKGINLYSESSPHSGSTENNAVLSGPSQLTQSFILKAPASFADNLCVSYTLFQCFQSDTPATGDLIVILPGIAEPKEIKALKADHDTLLAYQHQPNFSQVERLLLNMARPPARFQQDRLSEIYEKEYDVYNNMDTYFSFMDVYLFQKR